MNPSRALLRRETRNYLATVPDAAENELAALTAWVEQGNSPYCNSSHIADEKGREMPFIHAMRVENELAENTASEITNSFD